MCYHKTALQKNSSSLFKKEPSVRETHLAGFAFKSYLAWLSLNETIVVLRNLLFIDRLRKKTRKSRLQYRYKLYYKLSPNINALSKTLKVRLPSPLCPFRIDFRFISKKSIFATYSHSS